MSTTTVASGSAGGRWEQAAGSILPIVLGAGVFAVAFVHVHDVAKWAGQPGWAAYLIAMTGEAMAIAALAGINSRRRTPGAKVGWPVFVLVSAVLFSGACNLAAVTHRPGPNDPPGAGPIVGQPGPWVGLMAVWPVVAFGLVAGLKATKPGHSVHVGAQAASTTSTTHAHTSRVDGAPANVGSTSSPAGHTPLRAPDITPASPPAPPVREPLGQVEAAVPLAASWARVGEKGNGEQTGRHMAGHIPARDDRSALTQATDHVPAAPVSLPPVLSDRAGETEAGWVPPAVRTDGPSLAPPPAPRTAEVPAPRVEAVQFRAPRPALEPPTTDGDGRAPGDPDVSDLLPDSRKVRDALAKSGASLNRKTLHAGLKEYGHRAGTRRLDAVLRILREPVMAP
ncbi:hypothetical protein [Frankia sp. CiP3]|uniref:hypothetical protein n=1 Tax=Frankia sp. CiP3 TaxID=2880971 RepID=UPI001EF64F85|nr:hypothetical protein [Frankia sp. CiP3]